MRFYKYGAAALASALLLCSCALGSSEPVDSTPVYTEPAVTDGIITDTETVTVTETVTETEAVTAISDEPVTVTVSSPEQTSDTQSGQEDTADGGSGDGADVTEIGASDGNTDGTVSSSAESEIITETEYSEMLVTSSETAQTTPAEPSEPSAPEGTTVTTTVITETTAAPAAVITEAATTAAPAPVVIPKIYTGSFTGENTLENDLARVDISDVKNGVVQVKYKGSCSKVKVRITKGDAIYDYNLDSAGSVFPLQSGNGTYNVKVLENVSGKTYAIALDMDFDAGLSDGFRPFLMPTQYINYSGSSRCVAKAAELCAGKNGTIEKASAIFLYITDSITYDKELAASVKSGYVPDPDSTMSRGKGICFDYASLFASMCRSQNIPSKLVMGYVRGNVYHAWNEIYTEETGWVTVDLFLGSKGWELLDPTFYASAGDNKEEVSKYIGSGSDYSAVYYY